MLVSMLRWYRRHSHECEFGPEGKPEQGLRARLRAKYPKEREKDILDRVRYWKSCGCQLWWCGTWAGKTYPREALGVNDWQAAEKLLEEKMAPKGSLGAKVSLKEALESWHTACEIARRARKTIRNHRWVGQELMKIAGEETPLAQIDNELITALQLEWVKRGLKDSTHRHMLLALSAFYSYAIKTRKWVTESPLPLHKDWPAKPTGEDREETLPIDPEGGRTNYDKILASLRGPRAWGRKPGQRGGRAPRRMRGERLALQCELMYEGGLRISDAIMFQPKKLVLGQKSAEYTYLPIKTEKKRRRCSTYIPLRLAKELQALSHLTPGYPFWDGRDRDYLACCVRAELAGAGEAAGVEGVRPHRFRDSFAVNKLDRGVPIEVVSKMLGHQSILTTEESYAPWVRSRNDYARREAERAMESERDTAAPNVVPIRAVNE